MSSGWLGSISNISSLVVGAGGVSESEKSTRPIIAILFFPRYFPFAIAMIIMLTSDFDCVLLKGAVFMQNELVRSNGLWGAAA